MRKLKDLTKKQVVKTTPENDLAFRQLLDKEGFRLNTGKGYEDLVVDETNPCYSVKSGTWGSLEYYIYAGCEILNASDFLTEQPKTGLEKRRERRRMNQNKN